MFKKTALAIIKSCGVAGIILGVCIAIFGIPISPVITGLVYAHCGILLISAEFSE